MPSAALIGGCGTLLSRAPGRMSGSGTAGAGPGCCASVDVTVGAGRGGGRARAATAPASRRCSSSPPGCCARRGAVRDRPDAGRAGCRSGSPPTSRSPCATTSSAMAAGRAAAADARTDRGSSGWARTPYVEYRLAELSKGTAQKVGLAQALLRPPGLLVLDEPWEGLDAATRELVPEHRRRGDGGRRSGAGQRPPRRDGPAARRARRWTVADGTRDRGGAGDRRRCGRRGRGGRRAADRAVAAAARRRPRRRPGPGPAATPSTPGGSHDPRARARMRLAGSCGPAGRWRRCSPASSSSASSTAAAGAGRRGVRRLGRDPVPGARLADQARCSTSSRTCSAGWPGGRRARPGGGRRAARRRRWRAGCTAPVALVVPWLVGGVAGPQGTVDPALARGRRRGRTCSPLRRRWRSARWPAGRSRGSAAVRPRRAVRRRGRRGGARAEQLGRAVAGAAGDGAPPGADRARPAPTWAPRSR